MDELYQAIEEKIKAAGYPREISGQAVYEEKKMAVMYYCPSLKMM